MTLLWESFTPGAALAGGALIGLAAAMVVMALGRVMGISGIVGSLLQRATWRDRSDWGWRLAFVVGLVLAPLVWQGFRPLPPMQLPDSPLMVVVAGLLVGWGTRLGAGCTSGHGVCGLSRLSIRSLVATLVFIASGAITVFIVRHVLAVA